MESGGNCASAELRASAGVGPQSADAEAVGRVDSNDATVHTTVRSGVDLLIARLAREGEKLSIVSTGAHASTA
jgi:hypothetical protein